MTVVSFNMAYRSFQGGSGRLDTRLDTPPSINRRHPNSCLARVLAIDALENAAQSSDLSEPAMNRIFDAHRLLIELRAAQKVNAGLLDSNGCVLLGADDI